MAGIICQSVQHLEGFPLSTVNFICGGGVRQELAMGDKFNSFPEAAAKIKTFCKENFHPIKISRSTVHDKSSTDFYYRHVFYSCVHFGTYRSRSTGIRQRTKTHCVGCRAGIKLRLCFEPYMHYQIKFIDLRHNHVIGADIYKRYSKSRSLTKEERDFVQEIMLTNAKNRDIRLFVQANMNKMVTKSDIGNIYSHLKKKAGDVLLERKNVYYDKNYFAQRWRNMQELRNNHSLSSKQWDSSSDISQQSNSNLESCHPTDHFCDTPSKSIISDFSHLANIRNESAQNDCDDGDLVLSSKRSASVNSQRNDVSLNNSVTDFECDLVTQRNVLPSVFHVRTLDVGQNSENEENPTPKKIPKLSDAIPRQMSQIKLLTDKLAEIICQAEGAEFEDRLNKMAYLAKAWENGEEVIFSEKKGDIFFECKSGLTEKNDQGSYNLNSNENNVSKCTIMQEESDSRESTLSCIEDFPKDDDLSLIDSISASGYDAPSNCKALNGESSLNNDVSNTGNKLADNQKLERILKKSSDIQVVGRNIELSAVEVADFSGEELNVNDYEYGSQNLAKQIKTVKDLSETSYDVIVSENETGVSLMPTYCGISFKEGDVNEDEYILSDTIDFEDNNVTNCRTDINLGDILVESKTKGRKGIIKKNSSSESIKPALSSVSETFCSSVNTLSKFVSSVTVSSKVANFNRESEQCINKTFSSDDISVDKENGNEKCESLEAIDESGDECEILEVLSNINDLNSKPLRSRNKTKKPTVDIENDVSNEIEILSSDKSGSESPTTQSRGKKRVLKVKPTETAPCKKDNYLFRTFEKSTKKFAEGPALRKIAPAVMHTNEETQSLGQTINSSRVWVLPNRGGSCISYSALPTMRVKTILVPSPVETQTLPSSVVAMPLQGNASSTATILLSQPNTPIALSMPVVASTPTSVTTNAFPLTIPLQNLSSGTVLSNRPRASVPSLVLPALITSTKPILPQQNSMIPSSFMTANAASPVNLIRSSKDTTVPNQVPIPQNVGNIVPQTNLKVPSSFGTVNAASVNQIRTSKDTTVPNQFPIPQNVGNIVPQTNLKVPSSFGTVNAASVNQIRSSKDTTVPNQVPIPEKVVKIVPQTNLKVPSSFGTVNAASVTIQSRTSEGTTVPNSIFVSSETVKIVPQPSSGSQKSNPEDDFDGSTSDSLPLHAHASKRSHTHLVKAKSEKGTHINCSCLLCTYIPKKMANEAVPVLGLFNPSKTSNSSSSAKCISSTKPQSSEITPHTTPVLNSLLKGNTENVDQEMTKVNTNQLEKLNELKTASTDADVHKTVSELMLSDKTSNNEQTLEKIQVPGTSSKLSLVNTEEKRLLDLIGALTLADINGIVSEHMLSDKIINLGQTLIKIKYPNARGLQDVQLGLSLSFEVLGTDFVQILHCGSFPHWITVSTLNAPPDTAYVYDSLNEPVPRDAVPQICNIMKVQSSKLTIISQPMQMQLNHFDCGFFALATVITLLSDKDPTKTVYDRSAMREHLLSGLMTSSLEEFPVKKSGLVVRSKVKKETFDLHCLCRQPELENVAFEALEDLYECTLCKKKYHRHCQLKCCDNFFIYS